MLERRYILAYILKYLRALAWHIFLWVKPRLLPLLIPTGVALGVMLWPIIVHSGLPAIHAVAPARTFSEYLLLGIILRAYAQVKAFIFAILKTLLHLLLNFLQRVEAEILANGPNPAADIDLTTTTDFEELACFAGDTVESVYQDASFWAD